MQEKFLDIFQNVITDIFTKRRFNYRKELKYKYLVEGKI